MINTLNSICIYNGVGKVPSTSIESSIAYETCEVNFIVRKEQDCDENVKHNWK